jgi:putative endonuclease
VTAGPAAHLRQGHKSERQAGKYLVRQGLKLLQRNYRTPFGEIDLIMQQKETLVFVEVRFRRSNDFGTPAETVDLRKQAKLRASAEHYLQRNKDKAQQACRFDIVAITVNQNGETFQWLQNAFGI